MRNDKRAGGKLLSVKGWIFYFVSPSKGGDAEIVTFGISANT